MSGRLVAMLRPTNPLAPLSWLVLPLPLWWVLGLANLGYFVAAAAMAVILLRTRSLRLPPGWGWWLAFLVWLFLSLVMLSIDPAGTIPGSAASRMIAVVFRLAEYGAATAMLVWAFNLDRSRVSTRSLVRILAVALLWTIAGGLLGVVAPHLQLTSPVEIAMPASLRSNNYVSALIHPAAAQLQDLGGTGTENGRPSAPYAYTNSWGNAMGLLLPFGVAAAALARSGRGRLLWGGLCAVAMVPTVLSLNRGLWVGVGLAVAAFWCWLVVTGRLGAALGMAVVGIVAVAVVMASPLGGAADERRGSQPSDDVRAFSIERAVQITAASPVLGYGSTRNQTGSSATIAVGRSPSCSGCGNMPIGFNGQLWFAMVAQGFVGAFFYVAFHVATLLRLVRSRSVVVFAGALSVLLSLWFDLVYDRTAPTACLEFLAIAVAVRATLPALAAGRTPQAVRS